MAEPIEFSTTKPDKLSHSIPINSVLVAGAKRLTAVANAATNAATGMMSSPKERNVNDGRSNSSKLGMGGVVNAMLNKANNETTVPRLPKIKTGGDTVVDDENRSTNMSNDISNSSWYNVLRSDDAEETVLSNVEKRCSKTKASEDGFRPAVEGEYPPLKVPSLGQAFFAPVKSPSGGNPGSTSSPSLKSIALKVQAMQRLERAAIMRTKASLMNFEHKGHHRRARSLLTDMDDEKEYHGGGANNFGLKNGSRFSDFEKVFSDDFSSRDDNGDDIDEREENFGDDSEGEMPEDVGSPHEGLPLLGANDEKANEFRSDIFQQKRWRARQSLVQSHCRRIRAFLNPARLCQSFIHWFVHSTLMLAIPLFIAAIILFYLFGNPEPPAFLPGSATLSWWLNFIGRHLLVFELARLCQFIMIDCLVLSSRFVSQGLGPWVTMFCIQSKGWPFIAGSWGLWSLILLHGDHGFQVHWLYFTNISIYSIANSGSYILNSDSYLRMLLCMVLAGVLGTLKRTTITLVFGRRMVDAYKNKLEDILNDVILISEIADLSVESAHIANEIGIKEADVKASPTNETTPVTEAKVQRLNRPRWSIVRFDGDSSIKSKSSSGVIDDREDEGEEPHDFYFADEDSDCAVKGGFYESSCRLPIKDMLDKWEEPVSKRDQSYDATVNDILKFRRALTYLDLDYPFSEAFGLACTRNEMILSAEAVYYRLMMLSPGKESLSFSEVVQILIFQEDGTEDIDKKRAIRNLFRPDADGQLSLVGFVQSCDTVYKKIRYFRASVGNASVIDHVLESIIDIAFFFFLGLIVMTLLNLNPWPLLVSLSTLLVAGSFAIGPTCAKAIEGILLVVGRRPYDIGDRIVIADKASDQVPPMAMSWIVEDITLFTTTLRFGSTNEVATFSNGSITNARITNCARSKNATISIPIKFHMSCHEGNTIDTYRQAVKEYIQEHPNIWDSVFYFRCEEIDPNNEVVTYRVAIRSRFSWQVSNKVIQYQGEFHRFLISLAIKLQIKYDAPNSRSIMYYGGSLVDGGVTNYKAKVLINSNINNENNVVAGIVPNGVVLFGKETSDGRKDTAGDRTNIMDEESVPNAKA